MHPQIHYTDRIAKVGDPNDDRHRQINYDLCRKGINMLALYATLDSMVEAGMHPGMAQLFRDQADALLQHMRAENNRIHGF